MSATDWAQLLTVVFAAIAAGAALLSIRQARLLHAEDAADRARDRRERSEQFEAETAERNRAIEADVRLRQLEQISRIGDLVRLVRQTAKAEANPEHSDRIDRHPGTFPFYWNARRQLEASIDVLAAMGGPDLPACRDLATSSAMEFMTQIAGGATAAFEELVRAVREVEPLTK